MKKKYAVHPGDMMSKNDKQIHRIAPPQLIRLYGVNPDECIVWDDDRPETYRGRNSDDYIHLYPRYDGNYKLPKS